MEYFIAYTKEEAFLAQKTTIIGAVVNSILSILKIMFGFLYSSHALLVDGIHSLSDLLTDIFVIIINKFSHSDPDEAHPYGHDRFETLGTLALGGILFATAGALVYENVTKLIESRVILTPKWPALIIAIVSVLAKEVLFHYTKKVANNINSSLMLANAWHHRTDAVSSIAVFIGILLGLLGYNFMDAVVAIIVAIMIGKIGWDFVKNSLVELSETAATPERVKLYRQKIKEIDGIIDFHNLRTRRMGNKVVLDINIQVGPKISVSEGHEISAWLIKTLTEEFHEIDDVIVHADVENDMCSDFTHQYDDDLLPLRSTVLSDLESALPKSISDNFENINMHYIDKKIHLEIFLKEELPAQQLKSYKKACLDKMDYLEAVNFLKDL